MAIRKRQHQLHAHLAPSHFRWFQDASEGSYSGCTSYLDQMTASSSMRIEVYYVALFRSPHELTPPLSGIITRVHQRELAVDIQHQLRHHLHVYLSTLLFGFTTRNVAYVHGYLLHLFLLAVHVRVCSALIYHPLTMFLLGGSDKQQRGLTMDKQTTAASSRLVVDIHRRQPHLHDHLASSLFGITSRRHKRDRTVAMHI